MSKGRLIIAVIIAIFSFISYLFSSEYNEVTGETQRIALSQDEEIALGLKSAPTMAERHGGLYNDENLQNKIDRIGNELVQKNGLDETGYIFDFHLLADDKTINAFALPGGQIFITYALYSKLDHIDQVAGVLGHEIGHVVARHGAEHLAKQKLTQGLTTATVIGTDSYAIGQVARQVGSLVNMKYGRDDEIESDLLGVRFLVNSGYNPEGMIRVMEILAEASGGAQGAEFFSTHPNPENRIGRIKDAIAEYQSQR